MAQSRLRMTDLARKLGVSQATVSNAFNRPDQLSPALRAKILAGARELGYTGPHPLASTLRRGHTGAVGLIVHEPLTYLFEDAAARLTMTGVAESCGEHGVSLVLVPRAEPGNPDVVSSALVDGFVAFCDPLEPQRRGVIRARGLPVIGIDAPIAPDSPYVGIDDMAAAASAATHLRSLGHIRIGIITFPVKREGRPGLARAGLNVATEYVATRARLAGYRAALSSAPGHAQVHVAVAGGVREIDGAAAAAVLLSRDPRPTALIAMSDRLALGAIAHARNAGLSVPAGLSIIGFDDIPDACTAGLTTIRQPHQAKGSLALTLALDPTRGAAPILLPTELVIRGTTAPLCG